MLDVTATLDGKPFAVTGGTVTLDFPPTVKVWIPESVALGFRYTSISNSRDGIGGTDRAGAGGSRAELLG